MFRLVFYLLGQFNISIGKLFKPICLWNMMISVRGKFESSKV